MKREPVQSSSIVSIGFDTATNVLEIEFTKGGNVYQFVGVPEFLFRGLMLAPSKGVFFNSNIEDRYIYRDVTPPRQVHTGLVCPNCRKPVGTVESQLPRGLSLFCPSCQFRWMGEEPGTST